MTGVTEELNKILQALEKKPDMLQLRKYHGTVNNILEKEPKNPLALYLKAKLIIISTNPQNRVKIKPEILNIANEMAFLAHSAPFYHRKWELLKDLNIQDNDVYEEQKNASHEILKIPKSPTTIIYHTIAEKFLQVKILRADFTADKTTGQPPLSVKFSDRSTGAPTSWTWQFGDGSTSREASPTHIYQQEGQYTVTLSVANQSDKNEIRKAGLITITKTIVQKLRADFTVDQTTGQPPLSVKFSDRSNGAPTSWTWQFGDGSTSQEASPTHIYQQEGQYTVTLSVANQSDKNEIRKAGLITVTKTIVQKLRADFTADQTTGQPPLSVKFFDRSTGAPTSWTWQFGDGNTSREASPTHIYQQEGQYTVTLSVANQSDKNEIRKAGIINVGGTIEEMPDPEGIYRKAISEMVKVYPEIIDLIVAVPHKKMHLNGYIRDAFSGETPKEFHIVMHCINEDIPLIILEKMKDKIKLNAAIETKKLSLKNKGISPVFVDWAVEVWKTAITDENGARAQTSGMSTTDDAENEF